MWQFLLAAAVAGSTGFAAAKHFLRLNLSPTNTPPCKEENTVPIENAASSDPPNCVFTFSSSKTMRQDGSTSRPKNSAKKHLMGRRGSKTGIRIATKAELRSVAVAEVPSSCGKRFPLYSKRRKTIKNVAGKTAFCSSKDGSLFGWGVSFGIICMMAGKAEISELNNTMNETAKAVEELKSELNRRKSSYAHQLLNSVGDIGMQSSKMRRRNDEIMLKKTNNELRDTDDKFWSLPVNDDGECGSSALTEEPDTLVMEMDQLEAELEFELQKLPGCTIDTDYHEETRPKLDEFGIDKGTSSQVEVPNEGCHKTYEWNFNASQYHGISASELNQKLSQLLIEQQENQIADLESELNLAQSKLQEKEAELQTLKDCVKRLSELPLSTVSDDETEAHKVTSNWDPNAMDLESKQSVVSLKRPIDSESCACYPSSDSDPCGHIQSINNYI